MNSDTYIDLKEKVKVLVESMKVIKELEMLIDTAKELEETLDDMNLENERLREQLKEAQQAVAGDEASG